MGFKGLKIDELIRGTHVDKEVQGLLPRPTDFRSPGHKEMGGRQPQGRSRAGGTVAPELEGPGGKEGSGRFQKKVWEMKFGLCGRGL